MGLLKAVPRMQGVTLARTALTLGTIAYVAERTATNLAPLLGNYRYAGTVADGSCVSSAAFPDCAAIEPGRWVNGLTVGVCGATGQAVYGFSSSRTSQTGAWISGPWRFPGCIAATPVMDVLTTVWTSSDAGAIAPPHEGWADKRFAPMWLNPSANIGGTDIDYGARPVVASWADAPHQRGGLGMRASGYDVDDDRDDWITTGLRVVIHMEDDKPVLRVDETPIVNVRAANPAKPDQKQQLHPRMAQLFRLMAFTSEANDVVDALFNSLPYYIKQQYAGRGIAAKYAALILHWRSIDMIAAIQWLAVNEFGDRVVGSQFAMKQQISGAVDPSGQAHRFIQTVLE